RYAHPSPHSLPIFLLPRRRPPSTTLFPYTTLFRSDRYQCSRDVVVNPRELRSVRIQVNLEKSLDQVAKLRRLCSTARFAHRASDECADAVPDERNDFVEGECATSVFREQRVQGRQQIRCAIDQSSVQI